jgi:REP element-mobilizing transposase RayT
MHFTHRKSIRLPEFDYASPGAYFITLVTWQRAHLFGEIEDGNMQMNRVGHLVSDEWQRLAVRFEGVQVEPFVVMPNHLHAILYLPEPDVSSLVSPGGDEGGDSRRARHPGGSTPMSIPPASPLRLGGDASSHGLPDGVDPHPVGARREQAPKPDSAHSASPCWDDPRDSRRARHINASSLREVPSASPLRVGGDIVGPSLGLILGAFKSTTTRLINGLRHTPGEPVWQRNYYEHILRSKLEWDSTAAYILSNLANWDLDNENRPCFPP